MDKTRLTAGLERLTQVTNGYFDHVRIAQKLVAPYLFEQLAAAQHALGVAQEVSEELESAIAQFYCSRVAGDGACVLVDADVSVFEYATFGLFLG
jgi:hypothetical protein